MYSLFPELWVGVCLLKKKLFDCLKSFNEDDFSRLDIKSLSLVEKDSFIATIKSTITNMDIRFPCASTSLNKRSHSVSVNCRNGVVDRQVVLREYISCPLRLLFEVYVFPGEFLESSTVKECLLSSFQGEVAKICVEMNGKRDLILSSFQKGSHETIDEKKAIIDITLDDLFPFVNRSDYPSLWKCVLKVRSIIPTTVSCEQSFSCLKRSNRVNTKIDNLCSCVDYRMTIRDRIGETINIKDKLREKEEFEPKGREFKTNPDLGQ